MCAAYLERPGSVATAIDEFGLARVNLFSQFRDSGALMSLVEEIYTVTKRPLGQRLQKLQCLRRSGNGGGIARNVQRERDRIEAPHFQNLPEREWFRGVHDDQTAVAFPYF